MRRRKDREINIFSASAIDLFASTLGVFILFVMILLPNFTLEDIKLNNNVTNVEELRKTVTQALKRAAELAKKVTTLESSLKQKTSVIQQQKSELLVKNKVISQFQDKVMQIPDKSKTDRERAEREKKIQSLQAKVNQKNREIQEVKKQVQSPKPQVSQEEIKKKDRKILNLKAEIERIKKSQKMQSLAGESASQKTQLLQQQIEELEKQRIEQAQQEEVKKQQIENLQLQAQESQNQLKNAQQQIEQLEKTIKKADQKSTKFAAVLVKWSTPKHDIDMVLVDPENRKFDFKNKRVRGAPGEFSLDTRQGPGMEVWQTERVLPGVYELSVKLYNQYGNTKPAKASVSIFTIKGKLELPEFSMTMDAGAREKKIRFQVDEEGAARVL